MTHPRLRWAPAVAIMAVIAWLSHQPQWPEAVRGYPDWVLHGLGYGALGAACWLGTAEMAGRLAPSLAAWLISVAYGGIDEFHQSFIPGREAAVHDVVADAVGAAAIIALLTFARLRGVWEDSPQVRRRPPS